MPQLDPINFISQIFWLFLIFSLIFLMVKFIIFPNFEKIFNLRDAKISNNLTLADQYKIESEKINAECIKIIEEAKKRAKNILDGAEKSIKEKEFLETQKLTEEIKLRFDKAEEEIKLFKSTQGSDQLKELKLRSSKIFVNAILEEDISEEQLIRLIDEAEKTIKLRNN